MKGASLPPINRTNTALVLNDMQNDFIKDSLSKPEMQAVVKRTRALIGPAHSLQVPVIYTRVETDPVVGLPSERVPCLQGPGANGQSQSVMDAAYCAMTLAYG